MNRPRGSPKRSASDRAHDRISSAPTPPSVVTSPVQGVEPSFRWRAFAIELMRCQLLPSPPSSPRCAAGRRGTHPSDPGDDDVRQRGHASPARPRAEHLRGTHGHRRCHRRRGSARRHRVHLGVGGRAPLRPPHAVTEGESRDPHSPRGPPRRNHRPRQPRRRRRAWRPASTRRLGGHEVAEYVERSRSPRTQRAAPRPVATRSPRSSSATCASAARDWRRACPCASDPDAEQRVEGAGQQARADGRRRVVRVSSAHASTAATAAGASGRPRGRRGPSRPSPRTAARR